MALIEGCKHALDVEIPADDVKTETGKVVEDFKKRVRLPGFRPGKAPSTLILQNFAGDVRQKVLEALIPKYLQKEFTDNNLRVVGSPNITDVHYHDGEAVHFKAEFEVYPEFELKEYRGISVPYHDPEVTDEDVNQRIEELRNQKSTFANIDPRPLEDGDYAVLSLESVEGVEPPVQADEMTLEIGGADSLEGFTENLRGMSPGEEKEFSVTYPEDYGQERLAGKTVKFRAKVNGVRKKELPELNDEFAQDLGDYRTVDELRTAVRKSIFDTRQEEAQREAKDKIVEHLVDDHDFPLPETFINRQIENRVEQRLHGLVEQGIDPKSLNLDWDSIKDAQKEPAAREVKASLLLSRVAEKESIGATRDEVDRQVERIARQRREAIIPLRARLEKDGTLSRIASHIQTEKTLSFLFENATKTA
ncbi:MAG TPA: trigger factor [Bryobacteraceae bacterium]